MVPQDPFTVIFKPFPMRYINLMGILQSAKPSSSTTPQSLSFTQAKTLAQQTADCLTSLREELRLDLRLNVGTMRYNQRDWRKSTIEGVLKDDSEEGVVIDLEQAYRLRELLQHLRQQTKTGETPTPAPNQQDRECCICFAEKATTVLPCTHSYCAGCTQRYIIEQQQHKCPQCRTQFSGNRDAIKRSFYEVIEEDRVVYEQARGMVVELLSKYNTRVARTLQQMQKK